MTTTYYSRATFAAVAMLLTLTLASSATATATNDPTPPVVDEEGTLPSVDEVDAQLQDVDTLSEFEAVIQGDCEVIDGTDVVSCLSIVGGDVIDDSSQLPDPAPDALLNLERAAYQAGEHPEITSGGTPWQQLQQPQSHRHEFQANARH